jgi:hypothetical protein
MLKLEAQVGSDLSPQAWEDLTRSKYFIEKNEEQATV